LGVKYTNRGRIRRALVGSLYAFSLGIVPTPAAQASLPSGAYVALGDSYASGPFIPNQVEVGCARSDHDYPSIVAASGSFSSFRDTSCSGATTVHMTQTQQGVFGIPEPPQFDALSADAVLVTVGIGGNDIGFMSIVTTCAQESLTNPFGSPCKDAYTSGGIDQLAAAIAATAPRIAAVLRGIHERAPQARVLLVGYPVILPDTGNGCWPRVPFAYGDVPYLRGVELKLNRMLAAQAAANGAIYVDTYSSSIGHDVCESTGTKWVEGLIPTSPAAPFHPNALGMKNSASAVLTLGLP
jgi:lysophospholipase L1-like esterase